MNHAGLLLGINPEDGLALASARKYQRQLETCRIGRSICFGKDGGSAPAPDPRIAESAEKSAKLGEEWLTFSKEQYQTGLARQGKMDELTGRVAEQQLATQDQSNKWALEDRDRYTKVFQPLQDKFIDTANNYDSAERQAEVSSEAKADVLSSAAAQKQISQRSMASMGIDPRSGRFAAIDKAGETNTALAAAGAQNSARNGLRDKALALKADAINIGAGLPAQSMNAAAMGLNAGSASVNTTNAANANFYANNGIMSTGYGGAMQGEGSKAATLNGLYGNQVNAWGMQQQAEAADSAAIGSAVGTGASLYL